MAIIRKMGLPILVLGTLLTACGAPNASVSSRELPTAHMLLPPTRTAVVPAMASATQLPTETRSPSPTLAPTPAPAITATAPISPTLGTDADPAIREAQLVAEINRVRAANGLPPYLHSPDLSATARAHSCDMATHSMISHSSSDGRTLQDRLAGAIPAWEWPSESIAAGFGDPPAIVALWMDEPPEGWHRRNILDADQREVGAGYCYAADDSSGNHHYWTADFARLPGE